MKYLFIYAVIICVLTSCSSTRPVATPPASQNSNSSGKTSIEFIDNISINGSPDRNTRLKEGALPVSAESGKKNKSGSVENYSNLQFKYSILENAPVEELTNTRLLNFMEVWYGTQYHYGGTNKDGIDCSAFVSLLMTTVYAVGNLPRISRDQYLQSRRVDRDELREGDLVFFHTQGRSHQVTHVGVYLRNNRFVHASISGVMISDMTDGYYGTHYVGAGRVLE